MSKTKISLATIGTGGHFIAGCGIEFNFSRFEFSYSNQNLSQSVNQLFTTLLNFNGFL